MIETNVDHEENLSEHFKQIESLYDIAELIEVPSRKLEYFCFRKKAIEQNYTHFKIKKQTGGSRDIHKPSGELLEIQRELRGLLDSVYEPGLVPHGYCKERSIVSNAAVHVGKTHVLNVDLEDFFPSIHFGCVQGMLVSYPYEIGEKAATTIANLCCLNGYLPQGAPTSPVLSDMICGMVNDKS